MLSCLKMYSFKIYQLLKAQIRIEDSLYLSQGCFINLIKKQNKKKTYLHPQEKCTKTKHPALVHLILASISS